MKNKHRNYFFFIALSVALSACYEDTSVVIHESHRYKGKSDFHSKTNETRWIALRQRFEQGQLDR